jgi:trehalose 6-phosphate phosphatase
MERDGQRWLVSDLKPFIPELDKVRQWLERNVPPDRGFIVEDKRISIALHYRSAAPAESRSMCEKFADMVDRDTRLRLHHGKRVVEASPPNSGKGFAVRFLIQRYDEPILPVYFGDDLSDEDAFFTLREDGITVLVSAVEKVSWAKYRVESPFEVIQTLSDLADATNLENSKPAS